ncbi:IS3 family transposase [Bradyrhizobium sp. CCBAU 11445]|uniref:IS3 family transposase n=1 Tax=Bradyrhizobium sp. CCBAU 11445 TaxID=1630896 RepID=UPI003FA404FE
MCSTRHTNSARPSPHRDHRIDELQGQLLRQCPIESFFHSLKAELAHHRQYHARATAQRDIFAFIEGFYNRTKVHSATEYRPDPDGAKS